MASAPFSVTQIQFFDYKSYLYNNRTNTRTHHIHIIVITKHFSSLIKKTLYVMEQRLHSDFTVTGTGGSDVICFLNLAFENRHIISEDPYL